jgi:hypothetical protein
MSAGPFLLAANIELGIKGAAGTPLDKGAGLVLGDVLLVLGAVLTVSLVLVVWAKYLRRSKHHSHHHHHHRRSGEDLAPVARVTSAVEPAGESSPNPSFPPSEEAAADSDESTSRHHHRHRRRRIRRREHRPRNPTLAETGGLPPIRDPEMPPPSP